MKVLNTYLVNEVTDGSFTTKELSIEHMAGFSVSYVSGGFAGTVKIQGSNDPVNLSEGEKIVDWVDIASSSEALTNGDKELLNFPDAFYRFIRVDVTETTPGALKVAVNAKGV